MALLLFCAIGAAPTKSRPTWVANLAPAGEPGESFILDGTLVSAQGQPMRDVPMFVYHADARGNYSDLSRLGEEQPRLAGSLRTNVLGRFQVKTILPGLAEGIPHVHFEIAVPDSSYRAIPLNLARIRGAGSDTTFGVLPQMQELPNSVRWAYVARDTSGIFRCHWQLQYASAVVVPPRPGWSAPKR
jgi:Dioxygenase